MRRVATTSVWLTALALGAAFALAAGFTPRVARAVEASRLLGEWKGERRGLEVIWDIQDNGRMRIEERSASWSVRNDTLFVQFDPLGESGMTERAVYRILISTPHSAQRRMFVRGFDLGVAGLFLTQDAPSPGTEKDDRDEPPEPIRAHDTDAHPRQHEKK